MKMRQPETTLTAALDCSGNSKTQLVQLDIEIRLRGSENWTAQNRLKCSCLWLLQHNSISSAPNYGKGKGHPI